MAPGNYSLYAIQSGAPKFLIDKPEAITVQSGPNAGNSTGNNFELPGRQAKFLTIADLLVTAPGQSSRSPANSLTVAVEPGQTQQWYSILAGWTGYKNLSIQLSTNKTQITLTATDNQNQQFRGTLNANDAKLVKWLGNEGTAYLLRIDASPAQFGLQPVVSGASSTTGGSGEGESSTSSRRRRLRRHWRAGRVRPAPVSRLAASGSAPVSTTLASDAVTGTGRRRAGCGCGPNAGHNFCRSRPPPSPTRVGSWPRWTSPRFRGGSRIGDGRGRRAFLSGGG